MTSFTTSMLTTHADRITDDDIWSHPFITSPIASGSQLFSGPVKVASSAACSKARTQTRRATTTKTHPLGKEPWQHWRKRTIDPRAGTHSQGTARPVRTFVDAIETTASTPIPIRGATWAEKKRQEETVPLILRRSPLVAQRKCGAAQTRTPLLQRRGAVSRSSRRSTPKRDSVLSQSSMKLVKPKGRVARPCDARPTSIKWQLPGQEANIVPAIVVTSPPSGEMSSKQLPTAMTTAALEVAATQMTHQLESLTLQTDTVDLSDFPELKRCHAKSNAFAPASTGPDLTACTLPLTYTSTLDLPSVRCPRTARRPGQGRLAKAIGRCSKIVKRFAADKCVNTKDELFGYVEDCLLNEEESRDLAAALSGLHV